jgi:hypothetical protein
MAFTIFNNSIGFRPSGDVLKYWAMLPQVTSSIGDTKIPSLFGQPKSVTVPIIMVMFLVLIEGILVFQLSEEGVGFLAILAISIFDFVVAILPPEILMRMNLIPAEIDAHIFVNDNKLRIPSPVPNGYNSKQDYLNELNRNVSIYENKKSKVGLINWIFYVAIIALNIWKFFIYYGVLGSGIFIEPIGRFILTVILLSIIVHILYTKVVYVFLKYNSSLKSQLAAFRRRVKYITPLDETNKNKEIEFSVKYRPAYSGNQRIAQRLLPFEESSSPHDVTIELPHDNIPNKYRVTDFSNGQNICLVYTGLLMDPEIQGLYSTQDTSSKEAIIVTCKETQLSQFQN